MPNWNDILKEIQEYRDLHANEPKEANRAIDVVRRKYLQELHNHRHRNIIAYYSGFLSKPELRNQDINDEDKNGFMMAIHRLKREEGLDLILHTPGGNIAAAQSIVNYLHKMFDNDIQAIIPQIAMSAGTMIACSCNRIYMAKHSNIGPIDPQLRDVPAYGVMQEFRRAFREVRNDPTKIAIWNAIISQYRPTFLGQCENAIRWSNDFVREQLQTVMFSGELDAEQKAKSIVRRLSSYARNRTHERHIHFEECQEIGLNVEAIEGDSDFQDLLLTVHHCYMHSLMNTASYKMIENHLGTALVKQTPTLLLQQPSQPIR